MAIVAIAWIYVVLMMSITEHSVVAGIMTFLMYGVLPLTIILYVTGTPHRKRRREAAGKLQQESGQAEDASGQQPGPGPTAKPDFGRGHSKHVALP